VNKSSRLKTALVAVGSSLAAVPAAALELGEVEVHSTIGQPLRASIAYALGPNEALTDTCVTLQKSAPSSDLPLVSQASMIVTNGVIAITGSSVLREPLVTMRLNVRCPYTAQLTREYMMFIDPPGTASEPVAAPVAVAPTTRPQRSAPPVTKPRTVARQRPVNDQPIASATRYRVQPGDSLSMIAQRIENRPVGLWNAVNTIFDANPSAFIDNDPNKLKAGSWLSIPSFAASEPVTIADRESSTAAPIEPTAGSTSYEPAAVEPAGAAENGPLFESPLEEPVSALAGLEPGDIILDSDHTYVDVSATTGRDEAVVIPDTSLEGPAATSSSPNVPVARIQPVTPTTEPTTTNWLLWLGGGGLAIIVLMLLFGRRFRDALGSTPIAPVVPQRRKTDTRELETIADVEMVIEDDSPTEENLALDADLIIGTGLQDGADIDVAQDFGFAATTNLDHELPEEMSSGYESQHTDMIAAITVEQETILESEILPDDDDYDMSVIVDATKMPIPDEVTEKDLEAIHIDSDDGPLISDDYTVSHDVDYKILEQDYEDELTATQALNVEIAKAAEELASRMDGDVDGADTEEMPLATVHELDVTAQLHSKDTSDDDTGVNPTVSLEAEDKTVEMTPDSTAEMPKGGSKTG